MACVSVTTWSPAPGRMAEAQALLKEVLGIQSGFGAVGKVSTLLRGGVQGTMSVVLEYPDAAAYGAALDRSAADPAMQAFVARAQQAQAMTPVRAADYVELPQAQLAHADIASHTALVVTLFKTRNGKHAQSLERTLRAKAISERHGGKVRVMQSAASDVFGVTATTVYYPDFTAWGQASKAMAADPDLQALAAETSGDQASSDFLRTLLLRAL